MRTISDDPVVVPVLLPALPAIAEFTCLINDLLWPVERLPSHGALDRMSISEIDASLFLAGLVLNPVGPP